MLNASRIVVIVLAMIVFVVIVVMLVSQINTVSLRLNEISKHLKWDDTEGTVSLVNSNNDMLSLVKSYAPTPGWNFVGVSKIRVDSTNAFNGNNGDLNIGSEINADNKSKRFFAQRYSSLDGTTGWAELNMG